MKKIIIKDSIIPNIEDNVSCIGYFDGVHRGHQALIKVCKDLAKMNNLKSMVICFDPDPRDIISNCKNSHLLSFKDRLDAFKELGVDIVCIIKFDEELMKKEPLKFIEDILLKLNIKTLVCGFDFSFGYKGKGNTKLLSKYLNTVVIDEIKLYSKKISSTRIKEAINKGNFKLSNKLLGYNYSLMLKVVNSARKGKKWLIECKLKDNSLVIPTKLNNKCLCVKNNHLILETSSELLVGDEILLVFENE